MSDNTNRNQVCTVWYTAKSKNATKDSRNPIDVSITPGMTVCLDADRHDGGGMFENVTRPATAILNAPKFLVVDVSPSVNESVSSGVRRGGPIKVMAICDKMPGLGLYVDGTTDNIAVGNLLGVVDGQFYLKYKASLDGTCCAVAQEAYTPDTPGYITEATFKSVT